MINSSLYGYLWIDLNMDDLAFLEVYIVFQEWFSQLYTEKRLLAIYTQQIEQNKKASTGKTLFLNPFHWIFKLNCHYSDIKLETFIQCIDMLDFWKIFILKASLTVILFTRLTTCCTEQGCRHGNIPQPMRFVRTRISGSMHFLPVSMPKYYKPTR